jgi:hypothetical protein
MPRRAPSTPLLLSAFALAAGTLAGCGGSSSSGNGVASKTPTEILASAKALADAAGTVHVSGSIVTGRSPITLDLLLASAKGGRGRLSENGLSFELIELYGTVYIKGSPAFYRAIAGPTATQLLQGKWLKAPANSGGLASLSGLTNLRALVDSALSGHQALAKGTSTTVNGQKVIGVNDSTRGGTLYVATTGPPYPIEITTTGTTGGPSGRVLFDHWNSPVTLTAPADAIDITQLRSGH